MFSFFKKKKIVAHLKLSGVIGNAGKSTGSKRFNL